MRDTPIEILVNKKVELERILGKHNAMLIAFSGGVDSTFLLAVATQVLKENVVAVTYAFPFHSNREIEEAIALGEMLGVTHRIINAKDLGPKKLTANLKDRCYHCKKQMGTALSTIAAEFNIKAIAHGANLDDEKDYRPGARAAEELGWIAPLAKAGLNKADIRALSKKMGLPTWNKPAMACLATRIPYGTPITKEALEMIDSAEAVLLSLGFSTCRVRHHGDVARIEVPSDEFSLFVKESLREDVTRKFRDIGFQHISLDLEGYVQGSMNRGIKIG